MNGYRIAAPHRLHVGAVYVAPTPSGTGTGADIDYNATGTESICVAGPRVDSFVDQALDAALEPAPSIIEQDRAELVD
jgi:hypothetical protein